MEVPSSNGDKVRAGRGVSDLTMFVGAAVKAGLVSGGPNGCPSVPPAGTSGIRSAVMGITVFFLIGMNVEHV